MMLGKRGRRRTTSMTGITVDLEIVSEQEPCDYKPKVPMVDESFKGLSNHQYQYSQVPVIVSPRYQQRISGQGFKRDQRDNFLRSCGLCNRRLDPGRDIYMYRGDTAFCSMECREQQMKQDERKDNLSNINPNSRKTENHHNQSEFRAANSETSSNSETIAAA